MMKGFTGLVISSSESELSQRMYLFLCFPFEQILHLLKSRLKIHQLTVTFDCVLTIFKDVFLMIRRHKTTIFTDAKECTTVYELKRIVEGILKKPPGDQRLYKVS